MTPRVIIAGSRSVVGSPQLVSLLEQGLAYLLPRNPQIVSGGARGADKVGEAFAQQHSLSLAVFPADWDAHGRAAGPIRNRAMLDYARQQEPYLVAIWDMQSRGTQHMVDIAREAGVPAWVIDYSKLTELP